MVHNIHMINMAKYKQSLNLSGMYIGDHCTILPTFLYIWTPQWKAGAGDDLRDVTTLWYMSLCKRILNAPVNHYLENVKTLSSLSLPIKHNVQKNMSFSVQGQGLPRWPTQSISLLTKSVQVAGFILLGNAGHAGRGMGHWELLWYIILLHVDPGRGCLV